jgi:hypothetical protein
MSVINTESDSNYSYTKTHKCILCDGSLNYPFLGWDNLCICGNCCLKNKSGLMADIVQVAASTELRRLSDRYYDLRLVRRTRTQVERDGSE